MQSEERAMQAGTGVFFVGLGLLFMTGWWWPGIMFVLAASIIARAIVSRESLRDAKGAFWLIAIGIVLGAPGLIIGIAGTFWKIFPFIMVALGLFMIFGGRYRPCVTTKKRKNDDDIHHV